MRILICGDMHLRDNLGYSEHITDGRNSEKKEIFDFILESSKDCDHVVFLGDFFNSRNNSSEINRQAVEFLERFKDKHIYIISGNHEKKGDSKTAIDFLKEITHSNWHIFTEFNSTELIKKDPSVGVSTEIKKIKLDFLPYMLKSELGTENDEQSADKIIKDLPGGDILFVHHSISDTTFNGMSTNTLKEIVLSKNKLEEKYKLVFAGHIHIPGEFGKTILSGSIFNNEVGETEKFIWKINDDLNIEKIKLPGRAIHKIENPTKEELAKIPKESIVKVMITNKEINIEEIKDSITRFDASLILENYPNERRKMHDVKNGALDFNPESLLKMYSDEKGVELNKLLKGFELIKTNE